MVSFAAESAVAIGGPADAAEELAAVGERPKVFCLSDLSESS